RGRADVRRRVDCVGHADPTACERPGRADHRRGGTRCRHDGPGAGSDGAGLAAWAVAGHRPRAARHLWLTPPERLEARSPAWGDIDPALAACDARPQGPANALPGSLSE